MVVHGCETQIGNGWVGHASPINPWVGHGGQLDLVVDGVGGWVVNSRLVSIFDGETCGE